MINAYAAGLIDGEGCITIAHREMRSFSARIDVGMSAKGMACLKRLQDQFGGQIRKTRLKSDKWKEAHAWGLFGKATVPFLEAVLPHLVLKHSQAEYALALQRMIANLPAARKGAAEWSADAIAEATCIRALVQELNRKGPEVEASDGWIARLVGGKWITPQRDLFSPLQWAEFSETFPRSGMTRSGRLSALPTLGRRTSENESGLWPTPRCADGMHHKLRIGSEALWESGHRGRLEDAVALTERWPTPQASDVRDRGNLLSGAIQRRREKGKQIMLSQSVSETSGSLNPTWVEWLMGYPLGWTDCAPSETA